MKMKRHIFFILIATSIMNVGYSQSADDFLNKGMEAGSKKDFIGAVDALNSAIDINQYSVKAYFFRGLAKGNLQDYYGAINDYSRVIELDPKYKEA